MRTEPHESDSLSYEYNHIVLRSSKSQRLFSNKAQRTKFLELVERVQRRTGICVLAYCLLATEVHFIVQAIRGTDAVSRFAGALKSQYARYVHIKSAAGAAREVQHLFVRHFSSKELQLPALQERIQWLHQQSVEERLVKGRDQRLWSSRRAHMFMEEIPWLHVNWALELNKPPEFPWPLPLSPDDAQNFVRQLIEVVADKVDMPSAEVYSRKRTHLATKVRAIVAHHAMRWGVTQECVIQHLQGESPVALRSSTITAAINHYEVSEPDLFDIPTQQLLAQVPHWRIA